MLSQEIRIGSVLVDKKVRGINVSLTLPLQLYESLAKTMLDNPFQRRRVRSKFKVYALLERDLFHGCIMPPIILAATEEFGRSVSSEFEGLLEQEVLSEDDEKQIQEIVVRSIEEDKLMILDGLQRTHTIKEAFEHATSENAREALRNLRIRVEIYLGLNKRGLLYRMLTLNTGQTPMSFRHQLEILFQDYLDSDNLPAGMKIVTESEDRRARSLGVYKYNEVVDLYQSYLNETSNPVDKEGLFDEIKRMDFIDEFEPRSNVDMLNLLQIHLDFVRKLDEVHPSWRYSGTKEISGPYGSTIFGIFSKSQTMTGLGCAIKKLERHGVYNSLLDLGTYLQEHFAPDQTSIEEGLNSVIEVLSDIQKNTRRYGDAQRGFFEWYFRVLLDKESEQHLNLVSCVVEAFDRYKRDYD